MLCSLTTCWLLRISFISDGYDARDTIRIIPKYICLNRGDYVYLQLIKMRITAKILNGMEMKRDFLLQRLMSLRHNGMIKVIRHLSIIYLGLHRSLGWIHPGLLWLYKNYRCFCDANNREMYLFLLRMYEEVPIYSLREWQDC